jgi:chromosome segregation ATPase
MEPADVAIAPLTSLISKLTEKIQLITQRIHYYQQQNRQLNASLAQALAQVDELQQIIANQAQKITDLQVECQFYQKSTQLCEEALKTAKLASESSWQAKAAELRIEISQLLAETEACIALIDQ